MKDDPINFRQAIKGSISQKWIDTINKEMKSIKDNDILNLVVFQKGMKPAGCK